MAKKRLKSHIRNPWIIKYSYVDNHLLTVKSGAGCAPCNHVAHHIANWDEVYMHHIELDCVTPMKAQTNTKENLIQKTDAEWKVYLWNKCLQVKMSPNNFSQGIIYYRLLQILYRIFTKKKASLPISQNYIAR